MSTKTARARRTGRRSPLTTVALLAIGLLFTGGAYALIQTGTASADVDLQSAQTIEEGQKLFGSNCATCHGMDATGSEVAPSLVGVGAASVDFQVGTGRMPLQATTVQAPEKPTQFTDTQVKELAAYVASLAPGPAIPDSQYLDGEGDAANGAELFRINCAMCHNVAAAGGALTEGKFAPSLEGVAPVHIYEAMVTGPQSSTTPTSPPRTSATSSRRCSTSRRTATSAARTSAGSARSPRVSSCGSSASAASSP
jgi:ubiquinol-cytochrome c reductase cytochrome c subunit